MRLSWTHRDSFASYADHGADYAMHVYEMAEDAGLVGQKGAAE